PSPEMCANASPLREKGSKRRARMNSDLLLTPQHTCGQSATFDRVRAGLDASSASTDIGSGLRRLPFQGIGKDRREASRFGRSQAAGGDAEITFGGGLGPVEPGPHLHG